VEGADAANELRIGLIGLGTRGTSLLRTLLELPAVKVVALCDLETRHAARGAGIVEKATGVRPLIVHKSSQLLDCSDVDAVVVALPCDLHASTYVAAIQAGKHLYGEKPLAPTLLECDQVAAESARAPGVVVHVGFQRRSNPRYREGVALARRGDLGELIAGRGYWLSSNGPMNGHGDWMARRARSGDWMVEQAVHAWDVFGWIKGAPPAFAFGSGRRDLFADRQPARDVTDDYSVQLVWADGFQVAFAQSWVAPADEAFTGVEQLVSGTLGGVDFSSGSVTFRDKTRPRQVLHPGPQPDTRLALQAFLDAIRSETPTSAPITLAEAREATAVGLLVRRAVDEQRVVTWDEAISGG
jgi:predicted dehydrogenase